MSTRTLRVAKALVALGNQGQIPPIPSGMTRLTHFTNSKSSNAIVNQGQNFRYGKHALNGTTDSYSNQQDVQNLIDTDNTGFGASRYRFGNHVLLMDLPHQHHRILSNPTTDIRELDNRYVAGYVDRDNGQFQANPNYAPHQVPAPVVKRSVSVNRGVHQGAQGKREDVGPVPIPVPSQAQPGESSAEDIW